MDLRRPCPHYPQPTSRILLPAGSLPFVNPRSIIAYVSANQNVGRDLVLGAAEFAKTREENEIIESFFRQGQISDRASSGFRGRAIPKRLTSLNAVIMAF